MTSWDERPDPDPKVLAEKPPNAAEAETIVEEAHFARDEPPLDHLDNGDDNKQPNRAIPQWAIDSLLFGMPEYTPATKIWGQMLSIAMSAQARGWTRMEFINEVTKTERRKNAVGQKRLVSHRLWVQLVACSRNEIHARDQVEKAWAQAREYRAQQGFRTAEDLVNDAIEKAWAWEDRLTEGRDGLSDNEALVMSYVIAFIEKRQMSRVTCPSRGVGDVTGMPHNTVARNLQRLTAKGFLMQVSRGRWHEDPGKRLAAIYSLGDPYTLRYGGRGGPSAAVDL